MGVTGAALKGWGGDPACWKAADGAIVGESAPDNAVKENRKNRSLGGLIGFQMHVGAPMKIEIRNIWLKQL